MKKIIILDKLNEVDSINEQENIKIFSVDHITHTTLSENKIEHILADTLIEQKKKLETFEQSYLYLNWFEKISREQFMFYEHNLLEIIDYNEFQTMLIDKLSKLLIVKNILDLEKPEQIITTNNILKIIKTLNYKVEIKLISEINEKEKLFFDTVEINLDLKILPKKIVLSRKKYTWIKNLLENIVCKIFNLEYKENVKKSILFLEFNPELYEKLFYEINEHGKQPVILNSRRSPVWNKKSINILKRTNSKVVTFDQFLNKTDKKEISIKSSLFKKNILKLFEEEEKLKSIFSINNISFWNLVKNQVTNMYLNRIEERLSYILISKKLSDSKNFGCAVSLNLSGEAEKIFSDKKKFNLILLQHGFANYSKQIRWHEKIDGIHLLQNKIAVWGNIMKNYLIENCQISDHNIIVSGSPRHDSFFENKSIIDNDKTILLTPRPIIYNIEGEDSKKYELYEETIKRIVKCISKNNLKLIVKLHPQQNEHNERIRKIIANINPKIEVFQSTPILNLLRRCFLTINLSPDSYDASTTILESMILKKPVIDVSLCKKIYDFEFLKDEAIYVLNTSADIEKVITEFASNKKLQEEWIRKSQIHLKKYLSEHGNASKILAKKLVSF